VDKSKKACGTYEEEKCVTMGKPEGKRSLAKPMCRWAIILTL
jgi:hypothetical protein